jgi:hypothetical protein
MLFVLRRMLHPGARVCQIKSFGQDVRIYMICRMDHELGVGVGEAGGAWTKMIGSCDVSPFPSCTTIDWLGLTFEMVSF